jgi:short subunit dehydrogenase-like uncharacterized protein
MINRASAFVQPDGRLTPAAWLDLKAMVDALVLLTAPPGPYANNAAAVTAGLAVGAQYYTATGEIRVVV